ncbi:hypothetical protein F3Y22_tig00117048pilonHSYRG01058 [Hibiscus syriacus]|uniref:Mechanosensitive ion channel MscS domain-containing protein n=1 Tax=Hibiscus syriacus TaxID=106335 RepID=A0A6A2WY60_HIBSY|nr:hypothetical protein F3Y22_tig00117048pilonHSYRG01058 [Hibiscus syriacus]
MGEKGSSVEVSISVPNEENADVSANKPPKLPNAGNEPQLLLTRRRSLAKPKSRFGGQRPYLIEYDQMEETNPTDQEHVVGTNSPYRVIRTDSAMSKTYSITSNAKNEHDEIIKKVGLHKEKLNSFVPRRREIEDRHGDPRRRNVDVEYKNQSSITTFYGPFLDLCLWRSTDEDDLLRFMIKEEVDLVFLLFEGSNTGKIDRKSFTNWVIKVYQDRKTLAHALSDTKTAIKQLNKLVTVILIIVTIVIWVLLMEIATTKVLFLLSSQLVVAVFIFGNTCKTMFEAIVFVMHPFDVGDRCVVDCVQLVVEEMNILTTVFLKLDKETVYYPNSVLATKPISNYYRSPDMAEIIDFSIDFTTPAFGGEFTVASRSSCRGEGNRER